MVAADIPREMMALKMSNDSMQAMALAGQRGERDYQRVAEIVVKQVEDFRGFAESVIYRKPVGRDKQTGQMKFAEGLSIRAAEAIFEAYGFCAIDSDVDEVSADKVKITAIFTDFCGGRRWKDSRIVSAFYRAKGGGMVRTPDDRFYDVVIPAAKSRLIREVITRCIPPSIRMEMEEAARKKRAKFLTKEKQGGIVKGFSEVGLTQDHLEKIVAKAINHWNVDDRDTLATLWKTIEDGETTVEAVLSYLDEGGVDDGDAKQGATKPKGDPSEPVGAQNDLAPDDPPKESGPAGPSSLQIIGFCEMLKMSPKEWDYDKIIEEFEDQGDAAAVIEDIATGKHPEADEYRLSAGEPVKEVSARILAMLEQIAGYKQAKRLTDLLAELQNADRAKELNLTPEEAGTAIDAIHKRLGELS